MVNITKFFEERIEKSVACTEPAAVSLAVSTAFNAIKGVLPKDYANKGLTLSQKEIREDIRKIKVKTDRDVFKNSLRAGISHRYRLEGIKSAVALGVFCNPAEKLKLFQDLNEDIASQTTNLIEEGKVEVTLNYGWGKLRIEAEVITRNHIGKARIFKRHSNITCIEVDGKRLPLNKRLSGNKTELNRLKNLEQLTDLVEFVENDLAREVEHKSAATIIEDAIKTNHRASLDIRKQILESKEKSFGFTMGNLINEGYLGDNWINLAIKTTGLTVEGRMAGFKLTIATCAGSGNMGLVVTLPLIALALWELKRENLTYEMKWDWDSAIEMIRDRAPEDKVRLIKAVGLAHLIANYISTYSGELSALCGCGVKAGIGTAAGIAYYLTKESKDKAKVIGSTINNMAGNITGMICDGAKRGCALKAATAVRVAIESALLALNGFEIPYNDGIVDKNPMMTLRNVGEVSKGMINTDKNIVHILEARGEN